MKDSIAALMYYLVFGFLYLVSLLPLRILFLLSDLAYFIIYYVTGYRKKIVMQNLEIAFPERSLQERKKIARQFYRNFADNFIETIKLMSASKSWINRHFTSDISLIHRLHDAGKVLQVHLAHNFNWEIANLWIAHNFPYKVPLNVYMPISNKLFNRLFMYIRTRTGSILLDATNMRYAIIPYRKQLFYLGLIADQNPGEPSNAYWINFFGRPTPFLKGPEKMSKGFNAAVVLLKFVKKKRGYYEGIFELLTETPKELPETRITQGLAEFLEKFISEHPSMWLWSHRRWKLQWKPEYGEVVGAGTEIKS